MSGSLRRVFVDPNLRRIQLAFFGSTLGDWAYGTAITVWAYSVGGATAVGVFQGIRFVAVAIAGPIGATVADKVSRKRWMMTTDAVRAVLVSGAAISIGLGGPPAVVFVLALASTMVGASFRSAQAGLIPQLVSTPDELTASNAVAANLEPIAQFSGPAIAAVLIGVLDLEVVLWLNVASFVWSWALVAGVRVPPGREPEPVEDQREEPGFLREVTAGFAEIARSRDLGVVSLLAVCQGLIWGALTIFTLMLAVDVLETGPEGVGYIDSVLAVGTVAGGLFMLARVGRGRLGRDMALGVLGWSLPLVVLAIHPAPVLILAAMVVIGFSDAAVNLGLDTIPQRVAPERVLSRVFAAVESSLIASMALGALAAPIAVHLVGYRWATAGLGVAVVAVVAASWSQVRQMDRRLVEPDHLATLRSVDLFASIPSPVLETLARRLERVSYAEGEPVLLEGESSDRFYLILSGSVEVTQDGRLLRVEGPGEFFGEIGLLRDVPRTATVTALETTELLALERDDFLAAVTGHSESASLAEDVVSQRLAV
ncbi:MFS transporter [Nocardioides sp. CN2-186]|uniref:MFS transporter n=1 Tax=Nocardioides tweenelious TaxID=3156607 RepID=UPI0032B420B3